MYIKKVFEQNIGPLETVAIEFPFNADHPKPVVFVGENGTGKSTLLSNIVDSFYEIAGEAFSNARNQAEVEGYQYYKAISPTEIHFGQKYMYSYIMLEDSKCSPTNIEYVFKSGELNSDEFKKQINLESSSLSWQSKENYKKAIITKENAESILGRDVICYFGPERYEKPFWLGNTYYQLSEFEHLSIKNRWAGRMQNTISVNNMTGATLQWLLDVIIDSRGDITQDSTGLHLINISVDDILKLSIARENIETIMSEILGTRVYFGLNFRNSHGSRFNINRKSDRSIVAPTLDALSTGQSALFNMFATIVRYSDAININNSIQLSDITGIVVIDEIELHLHSTLQREVLPKLIALFPRVQFIITTHSPLFLLGMDECFGEDGYEIYQMPEALRITAERFSEFQNAYKYLTKTQKYESGILSAISAKQERMLVITEGATDWKHMKAAYNELSNNPEYKDIFDGLDFDFLEYEPANSNVECDLKLEMGNKVLCTLCENYAKLKQARKIIFIADCDDVNTNKKLACDDNRYKSWGNNVYSMILPLPEDRRSTPNICIEHLYPDSVIKSEVLSTQGVKRRLYMGNEFDVRGISTELCATCERKGICGPNSISIIEGSTGERVTSFDDIEINLALPKMQFANMVLNKDIPFNNLDFSNFLSIFSILRDITQDRP